MTEIAKCRYCNAPLIGDVQHDCANDPAKRRTNFKAIKDKLEERPTSKGFKNVLKPGENYQDYLDRTKGGA